MLKKSKNEAAQLKELSQVWGETVENAVTLERKRLLQIGLVSAMSGVLLGSKPALAALETRAGALAFARDTLRFASVGAPQDMDTDGSLQAYFPNQHVWGLAYDGLTYWTIPAELDKAIALAKKGPLPVSPGLAKSWEWGAGRKTIRFHLRDAKSSWGNPLTADDVIFSVGKCLYAKKIGLGWYGSGGITTTDMVKAVDAHTVDFTFNPNAGPWFLQYIGVYWLGTHDSKEVKKHASAGDPFGQKWLASNTAGFGPYKLLRFEEGQRAVMKQHDGYWGGKREIPNVYIQSIPDSNSRLQLVLAGAADWDELPTPLQLEAAAKNPNTQSLVNTSGNSVYLVMNNGKAPFNTVPIRQAIARAIPYDDLVKAQRGTGSRWNALFPIWYPATTTKYWKYDYNPTAAKAALASVAGTDLTLNYSSARSQHEGIAIIIQTALNRAGLNVKLEKLLGNVFDERKRPPFGMDFYISEEIPFLPDALQSINRHLWSGGSLNQSRYKNATIDARYLELYDLVSRGDNPARQAEIVDEVQRIAMADLPYIPLVAFSVGAATKKGLRQTGMSSVSGRATIRTITYKDIGKATPKKK